MAATEAQKRAAKAWRERNRERASRNGAKGAAKAFVRHHATLEDLDELEQLIAERRKQLQEETMPTERCH